MNKFSSLKHIIQLRFFLKSCLYRGSYTIWQLQGLVNQTAGFCIHAYYTFYSFYFNDCHANSAWSLNCFGFKLKDRGQFIFHFVYLSNLFFISWFPYQQEWAHFLLSDTSKHWIFNFTFDLFYFICLYPFQFRWYHYYLLL